VDQATLVENWIEAGKDLIEALARTEFMLRDAFWSYDEEADVWHLHLISPYVDREGPRRSYDLVFDVIDRLASWRHIDPMCIKVVGVNEPIARTIAAEQQRIGPPRRLRAVLWYGTKWRDLFIYPRS
jgi:hypothetical protein